jgi:hypothetical protein
MQAEPAEQPLLIAGQPGVGQVECGGDRQVFGGQLVRDRKVAGAGQADDRVEVRLPRS